MPAISANAQRALLHLKAIKPRDGWSIECKAGSSSSGKIAQYRLLRRTIPLTDTSFVDIYYDESTNTVVGVLATALKGKVHQAQILVNSQGLPASRGQKIISIPNYTQQKTTAAAATTTTTTNASASSANAAATSGSGSMSYSAQDPNHQNELAKLVLGFILGIFGLRLLTSALLGSAFLFYIIALPAAYFYAVQTCPAATSFDAKKELKRVLRGHHLPDTHPDKPRGMFEQWTARIAATLTTELATFPGYEVEQYNVGNAVIGVRVLVPTANLEAYWIGAFSKWHYVYSRELQPQQR